MDPNQDPWQQESTKTEEIGKYQKPEETPILSILSLIFSVMFPPAGLVLSIISLHINKANPNLKRRKLALIALVISISLMVITTIFILYFFVLSDKYSLII